ncbi:MAG: RIP metalloprotease RseP [Gemmatimonadales bacterium]|nr:RIP metalloprotease RseP [Gemmatimonadales bacterium]MYC88151.1 RIP metalloprotease RseP [Candidatus Palauibacter denitrificans]
MIVTILVTVLVLGVLIFVHELGHFAAAKSVGIDVPRFSIGLGPKMVGFRRGGTEYVLSWIPLGGYVKMAGMADEEVTSTLEGGGDPVETAAETAGRRPGPGPGDFDGKPLWARVFAISAGVIMNWLFAVVAFAALAMGRGVFEPRIAEVAPGSPAAEAGLRSDDLIRRVDGAAVHDPTQVTMRIERRPGESIDIVVERGGEELTFVATPEAVEQYSDLTGESRTVGRVGITIGADGGRAGPIAALGRGWSDTAYWSGAILQFLGDLVTGRSSAREVGGPILIGEISGRAARAGFWELLSFMAIISVNLAIFNLLPIPVLDGGHLLFLGIEAVRGRALSVQARVRFTTVGMFFVLALMVWAVGNDVLRVLLR